MDSRGILSLTLCVALAITVFTVAMPRSSAVEEEFVLHPGYIVGNVTIPGFIIAEGSYVNAQSGSIYSASTRIKNNAYILVVEAGEWDYQLDFLIDVLPHSGEWSPGYINSYDHAKVRVAENQTVRVDFMPDATLRGNITVQGETVRATLVYASASGRVLVRVSQSGSCYSLPVFGGRAYWISVRAQLTDYSDNIQFPGAGEYVPEGGTATHDFTAIPGYIEGTVTVRGATIKGGELSAYIYDYQAKDYFAAWTKVSPGGAFSFPLIPHMGYQLFGSYVDTNFGRYGLENRYADVYEGQTTPVNWEIVFNSTISGEAAIAGVTPDKIEISASGPYGSQRMIVLTSEGEYKLENLVPGLWGISTYVTSIERDEEAGYYDRDGYTFPWKSISVLPDQQYVLNRTFEAGFVEGSVLSANSPAISNLTACTLRVESDATSQIAGLAYTNTQDLRRDNENYANEYDLFVPPGNWTVEYVHLTFDFAPLSQSQPYIGSYVTVNYPYHHPEWPFLNVGPNETVQYDLDLQMAQVTARLWVSTGEPFNSPSVQGNWQSPNGANGVTSVFSNLGDKSEHRLTFFVVPGTHIMTGRGKVMGSTTTFGRYTIVVEPGDIVLIDPDAPTVSIDFPTGMHQTHIPCITIRGNVTDESGVANFTINGVSVEVNATGYFEYEVCELVKGENAIEVSASDVHGNSVTIQRIVILVNTPPVAVIGGPYEAFEGSPISFDAGGSYDDDLDQLYYRWDFDNDGAWDTERSTDPTTSHTWDDEYSGTVRVEVFDGSVETVSSTTVTVTNAEPVIEGLEAVVVHGEEGTTVSLSSSFSDSGVLDTHTAIIDWGDGATSQGMVEESDGVGTITATHLYTVPGTYTIALTVQDDGGASDTMTYEYIVVNARPIADAGGPYSGVEGSSVIFDASLSYDANLDPLQFRWDFNNDGVWDTEYSTNPVAAHTWGNEYTGTVAVEVFDGYMSAIAYASVSVTNLAPEIIQLNVATDHAPTGTAASITGIFSDPGILDTHTAIVDWGDGTISDGFVSESGGAGIASASHIYTSPGFYTVTVTVMDDIGDIGTIVYEGLHVNAPPVADIGGPYFGEEGSQIDFDASASSDPDGDTLRYRWDFNNDGEWDTDYSTDSGAAYAWDNEHIGTVAVEVFDGYVSAVSWTTVVVSNAPPTITSLTATIDPTPVCTDVTLSGSFFDPGPTDTHTALIDWGDGKTSFGSVIENEGDGTVTATHIYTTPGVYRVTLTVEDNSGATDTKEFKYVVIYDPTGAFVTGGGQIDSPPGAFSADPLLTGKAQFGFVSKYQKGALAPDGSTQFIFHAGNLLFKSTSYDWMVVAGPKAQFKGTGTINGEGNYKFILTAIDGDLPGGNGVDKFRIKIWDPMTDMVIYDNNMGLDDDADPTTAVTHGSIKIHKK